MPAWEEGGRFAISVWRRLGSRIGTQGSTGDSVLSGTYKLQLGIVHLISNPYLTTFKEINGTYSLNKSYR